MPIDEAQWLAWQKDTRRFPVKAQDQAPPPFTDAEMQASTEPLAQLLPRSAKAPAKRAEALRLLCIQSPGAVSNGSAFDETNPAGRANLIALLNQRCGVPNG